MKIGGKVLFVTNFPVKVMEKKKEKRLEFKFSNKIIFTEGTDVRRIRKDFYGERRNFKKKLF